MSAEEVDYEEEKVETKSGIKRKGRGHGYKEERNNDDNRGGVFERIEQEKNFGPSQSIEGWIVFVTNVHQEAQEEDILDKFSEFGTVKNIHVNLDRRTGFVKGYAMVEYEIKDEAAAAIKGANKKEMFGETISVDWAFKKK
jgi:RNA-binding protein 8A